MDSKFKITDLINKSKNISYTIKNTSNSKPNLPIISMLPINNIITTATDLGIPWLVLLILCAILIFI